MSGKTPGYTLMDAHARHRTSPDTFGVPSAVSQMSW